MKAYVVIKWAGVLNPGIYLGNTFVATSQILTKWVTCFVHHHSIHQSLIYDTFIQECLRSITNCRGPFVKPKFSKHVDSGLSCVNMRGEEERSSCKHTCWMFGTRWYGGGTRSTPVFILKIWLLLNCVVTQPESIDIVPKGIVPGVDLLIDQKTTVGWRLGLTILVRVTSLVTSSNGIYFSKHTAPGQCWTSAGQHRLHATVID